MAKNPAPSRVAQPNILTQIASALDDLPAEIRKAARYVTNNRSEVAFRSTRSVAKSAGVSPPRW